MKPTTEQILSALNEMIKSKTELKAEKIELGLVDDIEKLIKANRDKRKKLDSSINNWYNKIYSVNQDFPKISKIYTSYDKSLKSLTSKLDALTKQAKELGIPPRDIPAYIEGSGTVKRSQDMVDEYLEAVKSAKAIKGSF
jgi:chromosome segregation ATPase